MPICVSPLEKTKGDPFLGARGGVADVTGFVITDTRSPRVQTACTYVCMCVLACVCVCMCAPRPCIQAGVRPRPPASCDDFFHDPVLFGFCLIAGLGFRRIRLRPGCSQDFWTALRPSGHRSLTGLGVRLPNAREKEVARTRKSLYSCTSLGVSGTGVGSALSGLKPGGPPVRNSSTSTPSSSLPVLGAFFPPSFYCRISDVYSERLPCTFWISKCSPSFLGKSQLSTSTRVPGTSTGHCVPGLEPAQPECVVSLCCVVCFSPESPRFSVFPWKLAFLSRVVKGPYLLARRLGEVVLT